MADHEFNSQADYNVDPYGCFMNDLEELFNRFHASAEFGCINDTEANIVCSIATLVTDQDPTGNYINMKSVLA